MSIQKSILALSPIAYYPLQETAAGTITDLSGSGLNGVTNGSDISYAQTGPWSSWPTQKLMTFPGSSGGYISVPNFPSMVGNYSYSFWVRKNSSALTHQALFAQMSMVSPNANIYFKVADPSTALFNPVINIVSMIDGTLNTGVGAVWLGPVTLTVGTTYHVVITADLTGALPTFCIYLNGSLVRSVSYSTANYDTIPAKGSLVIGTGWYRDAVSDYAPVSMAHLAFFQKCLTSSEVSRLYSVAMTNTGHTKVTGTVKNGGGTGIARVVRVYSRASGKLLGETTSDGSGLYTCHLYGGEIEQIFAIALDDDTAPDYNAAIIDYQYPIGA